MLYRFDQDDNYFEQRFKKITEIIKDKLIEEQTAEIGSLTSSSMRFGLILLSYEVLREALLFEAYNKIIRAKETLNKNDDKSVFEQVSILDRFNYDEDLIEQIKNLNMTFEQFLEIDNRGEDLQLLPDQSMIISSILTR